MFAFSEIFVDIGLNSVKLRVSCEEKANNYNILFIRNFNLSTNVHANNSLYFTGEKDIPRVWFPRIGRNRQTLLYYSLD